MTGKNQEALTVDQNGQVLTGERSFTAHEYTEDGLIKYENSSKCNHDILYEYKPGTNLVAARYVVEGVNVRLREFFEYDDNNALTTAIVDDGTGFGMDNLANVKERRVKRITNRIWFPKGLPHHTEERYLRGCLESHDLGALLLKYPRNAFGYV